MLSLEFLRCVGIHPMVFGDLYQCAIECLKEMKIHESRRSGNSREFRSCDAQMSGFLMRKVHSRDFKPFWRYCCMHVVWCIGKNIFPRDLGWNHKREESRTVYFSPRKCTVHGTLPRSLPSLTDENTNIHCGEIAPKYLWNRGYT